jgi:hypothetical protein
VDGGKAAGPRWSPGVSGGGARSRWRRDQIRRRRGAHSGRATLAALASGALVGLGGGLWLASAVGARNVERLPAVAAPPVEMLAVGSAVPGVAPPEILARLPITRTALALPAAKTGEAADAPERLFEVVDLRGGDGPLRVEYSLDAGLTRHVFRVLEQGRVALGHVIVLDPATGRVLAYASTDPDRFPATQTYPAASLVKVITAAAALDHDPQAARLPCRYSGSPYRLTAARVDPPKRGNVVSLRQALATSNNQCFAQLAVHSVGEEMLLDTISRFGWLDEPAPAHAAGTVVPAADRYGVGKLGCGLAGCRITPLHAAQLASALAYGEIVEPRWVDRVVDAAGRELLLPSLAPPRQVLSRELAEELRGMLVDTTTRGTARRAFRARGGRPLLGPVQVAGKTGSLSGTDPRGRYEWFIGVAPADDPHIAVAVVVVQHGRWWRNASQVASEVLRGVFCDGGPCRSEAALRLTRAPASAAPSPALDALAGPFEPAPSD